MTLGGASVMGLSVAEVEEWDAGSLRGLEGDLQVRAGTLEGLDESRGAASAVPRWGGVAADEAQATLGRIRASVLDKAAAGGALLQLVGELAGTVEGLQAHLAGLKGKALGEGLLIGDDGTVVDLMPLAVATTSGAALMLAAREQLRAELESQIKLILSRAEDA